jgi:hypothetical protein
MMANRLIVKRGNSGNEGTFGEGELVNAAGIALWSGDSIELPWRDNKSMISCVPAAIYQTKIVYFGAMGIYVYELQDVPGRTDCLIHPANWAGDTAMGYYTELHGCTALGNGIGILTPNGYGPQQALLASDAAFKAFMLAAAGDTLEVQYLWADVNPEVPA